MDQVIDKLNWQMRRATQKKNTTPDKIYGNHVYFFYLLGEMITIDTVNSMKVDQSINLLIKYGKFS